MIRSTLGLIILLTVLIGPLVAIAAATSPRSFSGWQSGSERSSFQSSRSLCYVAGISCSRGPTLLPAIIRLK